MKISYNWLRNYISPIPSPEECSSKLTASGLEVESMEKIDTIQGGLRGLVVAEVKSCEPHPNADRLKITQVDAGNGELIQVVCGAPNVAAGQKVILATVGAELFPVSGDSFQIKKSKIRGEVSEGMICAEDEIGLGESHAGIIVLPADAQLGMAASDYYGIKEDVVFEIGLTPNRTDATSHFGVARDLRATLYKDDSYKIELPETLDLTDEKGKSPITVEIKEPELLKRYSGIYVENIEVKESPDWLKNSLLAIGQRPVNNIVDITNYVMHEIGQPLHAFDADKIKGNKIIVQTCKAGSPFTTLDGVKRELKGLELMICDEDMPLCIAGVFGGADSGVSSLTKSLFIESACFDSVSVRKTARLHGLNTDSSFRFERGTDPEATVFALERALKLIFELAGGKVVGSLYDFYPEPVEWAAVNLRWKILDRLVGEKIPREDVTSILKFLGIRVEAESATGLKLSIPPFKVDVKNEADITEEILRIYGYNTIQIPSQVSSSINIIEGPDVWKIKNRISDLLCSVGLNEVLNNSLSAENYVSLLPEDGSAPVKLLNALSSELNVMRKSLMFGICESLSRNINRQQSDVAFYEWGKTYRYNTDKGFIEEEMLALALCGDLMPMNWLGDSLKSGFYPLKGIIQTTLKSLGIEVSDLNLSSIKHPGLSHAFELFIKKKSLGVVGELSQATRKQFGLPANIWFAELNWKTLLKAHTSSKFSYKETPKFPVVRRDLALVIDESVSFESIYNSAAETERKILKDISLFDVYAGEKLPKGKKSYAVSFLLQDDEKTLTDVQVEKTMVRLLKSFQEKLGAELRN
ncbi:MAG: phenylalanine--tRNA ligase subunit beta [Bacteroidia bacterium]